MTFVLVSIKTQTCKRIVKSINQSCQLSKPRYQRKYNAPVFVLISTPLPLISSRTLEMARKSDKISMKGSKRWLIEPELVGLSEKRIKRNFLKCPQWKNCAVRDSVYAHIVIFNRVGILFRRARLCKNL